MQIIFETYLNSRKIPLEENGKSIYVHPYSSFHSNTFVYRSLDVLFARRLIVFNMICIFMSIQHALTARSVFRSVKNVQSIDAHIVGDKKYRNVRESRFMQKVYIKTRRKEKINNEKHLAISIIFN